MERTDRADPAQTVRRPARATPPLLAGHRSGGDIAPVDAPQHPADRHRPDAAAAPAVAGTSADRADRLPVRAIAQLQRYRGVASDRRRGAPRFTEGRYVGAGAADERAGERGLAGSGAVRRARDDRGVGAPRRRVVACHAQDERRRNLRATRTVGSRRRLLPRGDRRSGPAVGVRGCVRVPVLSGLRARRARPSRRGRAGTRPACRRLERRSARSTGPSGGDHGNDVDLGRDSSRPGRSGAGRRGVRARCGAHLPRTPVCGRGPGGGAADK